MASPAWTTMTRGQCNADGCDRPARKGSAYYCDEHSGQARAKRPIKGGAKAREAAEDVTTPAREIASIALDQRNDKAPPTKAPTMDEWEKVLFPILIFLTHTIAFGAVSHRQQPGMTPDERAEVEATYEALCMSDDDVAAVMHPLVRMWTRTSVNEKYGRYLLENADIVFAAYVLFEWGRALKPFYAEKRQVKKARAREEAQIKESYYADDAPTFNDEPGPSGQSGGGGLADELQARRRQRP